MPAENPKSEELSENKDDGDSGSGFKLNAAQNKTRTIQRTHTVTHQNTEFTDSTHQTQQQTKTLTDLLLR